MEKILIQQIQFMLLHIKPKLKLWSLFKTTMAMPEHSLEGWGVQFLPNRLTLWVLV